MHGPPGPLAARAGAAPGCRTRAAPRPPTSRTFSRSRPKEPGGRQAGGGRRSAAAEGVGQPRRGGGAAKARGLGYMCGRAAGARPGWGGARLSPAPSRASRARGPDATAAQRRGGPLPPSSLCPSLPLSRPRPSAPEAAARAQSLPLPAASGGGVGSVAGGGDAEPIRGETKEREVGWDLA